MQSLTVKIQKRPPKKPSSSLRSAVALPRHHQDGGGGNAAQRFPLAYFVSVTRFPQAPSLLLLAGGRVQREQSCCRWIDLVPLEFPASCLLHSDVERLAFSAHVEAHGRLPDERKSIGAAKR